MKLWEYAAGVMGRIPFPVYWGLLTAYCIWTVLLLWRKGLREGLCSSAVLLLVEWVLLIVCYTLVFREGASERAFNLVPLWSYFDYAENICFTVMATMIILNVVLFVPLGFLLGCAFKWMTWQRTLVIGAALSVVIQVLQLVFKRGLCEVDDVIHNVLGCVIGYGLSRLIVLQNQ